MTDAIAALVASLGDFPLDPDSGRAWLWSGGGDRLLWASAPARDEAPAGPADAALVRSFAPLLALPAPDREPIRVHQLSPGGQRAQVHTCLCRHVPLRAGGFGLLAVAIGAAARSMAEVRGEEPAAAETSEPATAAALDDRQLPLALAEQAAPGTDAAPASASSASTLDSDAMQPELGSDEPGPELGASDAVRTDPPETEVADLVALDAPEPEPAPPAAPDWTLSEPADRSPIRFVWQTDAAGRFIHISRELAAAVGPGRALLLGMGWEEFAKGSGLSEWQGVAAGFRSGDTWTAPPVLWPVEGAPLGVPVEMAGLKVLEAGRFDGFRGYGIARIERASPLAVTAAAALSGDADGDDEDEAGAKLDRASPEPPRQDLRDAPLLADTTADDAAQADADSTDASPSHDVSLGNPPPETAEGGTEEQEPLTNVATALGRDLRRRPPAVEPAQADEIEGAAEPVLPPSPAPAPGESLDPASPLSAAEREAFREIAKALGAMTEHLGGRPAREASAPRDVRPLELLKRDIVRLTGPEAAPLAPIDLDQARRERQARTGLPQAAAAAMLDAAPAGLLVMQDGKPVFANRHLLELAGYPDFETFQAERAADRLFQRGAPDAPGDLGRFEIMSRSGEASVVEARVQPLAWGGEAAALTTLRAVAEPPARHKALELELRAAEGELRELRAVLDTATDGVILLDADGRILSLNRSAEALFGYDQNEIAGDKLTTLLEPDSHLAALDYLDGLKSNGVKAVLNDGRDVRGRERNGGAIPLFMTIGRVGEREGGVKFCAVLRDVTHWKKVEADLLEAKRAAEDANAHKSDFLATISHELRTPLNAIIGFSQVMLAESFGPIGNDRYRQYAKDIHASGEHVVSLVNDLLDLSKIAAGRLDLAFGSVDVNAVVAESVAMIQPQANAGKVIVRSQLATDLPAVVADERSLRQIMLNLLSNAAKFTEAGGQVVASTSLSEAGEVVIRVSDTGVGMAEDEVRRAMEPFRQIPGPRASGGTGLGLPLTKALVEANRAAFAIRSEPRKGTLVEVTFPSTRVLAE